METRLIFRVTFSLSLPRLKPKMTTPKVVTVNESDLQCLICLDVLFHPYTLSACGHTFCGLCLQEKDLKIGFRHSTSVLCPHCRTNLGCVPSLFKNIQLSQLCESAYWTLPENNDKRREKQAQYDKRRAEIKRETELSNRKRSFTEFKAELNKLISYRGDILDPESAKKMRTFVDEEMRMLPIEGPVPPIPVAPAPAPIVVDVEPIGPPYSPEQLTQMSTALKGKVLVMRDAQTDSFVRGFLEEIKEQVPELIQTVAACWVRAGLPIDISSRAPDPDRANLGRIAADSWLPVTFPFWRRARPPRVIRPDVDDDSHRRRAEEKKAPISSERKAQIAVEIVRNWDYFKRLHSNSWMEAYLNEFITAVPGIMAILPDDVRDWRPSGQDPGTPAIREQSRRLGRNAAQVIVSKYLRPSGTQQQPA